MDTNKTNFFIMTSVILLVLHPPSYKVILYHVGFSKLNLVLLTRVNDQLVNRRIIAFCPLKYHIPLQLLLIAYYQANCD